MLPPCLKGEEKYSVVSVVAVKFSLVVNLEARKYARCYCLVNALLREKYKLAVITRMRLAVRSCEVTRIDKLKTLDYAYILHKVN